jgi:hypothetical protein
VVLVECEGVRGVVPYAARGQLQGQVVAGAALEVVLGVLRGVPAAARVAALQAQPDVLAQAAGATAAAAYE